MVRQPVKYIVLIIIILAIGGGTLYFLLAKTTPLEYLGVGKQEHLFALAEYQILKKEIRFSGSVVPKQRVDLAFEEQGKITSMEVDIGDKVATGTILASIDQEKLKTLLYQARADLSSEQAKLRKLEKGTRQEEIDTQKQKVDNYTNIIEDAKKQLVDSIKNSYVVADDIVFNKTDIFFSNVDVDPVEPTFLPSPFYNEREKFESMRKDMSIMLRSWSGSLNTITTEQNLEMYLIEAKNNTGIIKNYLKDLTVVINKDYSTASDVQKTNLGIARTDINAEITKLTAAEEKLNTAISGLKFAEKELTALEAKATEEDLAIQHSRVDQKKSAVSFYEVEIEKTVMESPISGTVSKRYLEVGEIATPNTVVLSLVDDSLLEIEADVSELEIGGIKVGDKATVLFDDVHNSKIYHDAVVAKIDPEETVINNVPTYKVTLQFAEGAPEHVLIGMTANVTIAKGLKEALLIPASALHDNGFRSVVYMMNDEKLIEYPVEIGMYDAYGNVEVTDGIDAGDSVIINVSK